MVTKDSLIRDREQANVALLKIKQTYNKENDNMFLIVEGKDDIAYFKAVCLRYSHLGQADILPANNRKNVIATFTALDWNVFSKDRVLFFVDRDLTDITNEFTPISSNIYTSDAYSIENSLFDEQLLYVTLQVLYGVYDLSSKEKELIHVLYENAIADFELFYTPIMSWILCWRIENKKCNLNNINDGEFYTVNVGKFVVKNDYREIDTIITRIHTECGVPYEVRDVSSYQNLIDQHGGIKKYIRGKYLKTFFVKFLLSLINSFPTLFPARLHPKASINLGPGNALPVLCGYMTVPHSLNDFLIQHTPSSLLIGDIAITEEKQTREILLQ